MKYYILVSISLLLFSCSSEKTDKNTSLEKDEVKIEDVKEKRIETEKETKEDEVVFEAVNFEMDINKLSLSEIRILRNIS